MKYYPFNIGDYRKKTGHLSPLEHGIYRILLDSYYDNEGPLEADDAKLMRTHCIRSEEERAAFSNVISDFFYLDGGHYRNSGADEVIEKILEKSDKARASAEKRWTDKKAKAMRTHSEGSANGMLPNTQDPLPSTQITEDAKASLSEQGVPPCPHQDIISLYNKTLPELQQVIPERWSGARAKALQARWRESKKHQSLQFWERFFKKLREFPFYLGDNDRDWRADLGWLVKRKNFDNLVEKFISGTNK